MNSMASPAGADELGPGDRETAFSRLREIVGDANFIVDPGELEQRSKDTIPAVTRPFAFVYPGSVEEVQAIVRLANEFRIPLWTVSTGRNWGYGASTAVREGSLIVVLTRMNKVIELNEDLAYAVIEAGVTYRQFNAHLKQSGLKLWTDCTDGPPDGSVTGNALDRGMGVTDYCDHFGNICGMEVVLPSGELMHTGGGALGKCKTWNVHKWGTGPYLEGLFTQANFGIVTKVGVWLMPAPEAFNFFALELEDDRNLPALVDDLRDLGLRRIIAGGCHFFNDIVTFAVVSQYPPELIASRENLSDAMRAEWRKKYGVSHWSAGGTTIGSAGQVRANRAIIKKRLARYGRIEFLDDRKVGLVKRALSVLREAHKKPLLAKAVEAFVRLVTGGKTMDALEVVPHLYSVMQGNPSDYFVRHAYFRSPVPKPDTDSHPARDNCGLMWFAPIAPMAGKYVQEIIDLCEPLFREAGFDFYVASLVQNPRAVIVLMSIMYLKDDPEQVAKAKALYQDLSRITIEAGYQQYRTSVAYMHKILDQAPEFKAFANLLKSAADPNGIIAPGKYGLG